MYVIGVHSDLLVIPDQVYYFMIYLLGIYQPGTMNFN